MTLGGAQLIPQINMKKHIQNPFQGFFCHHNLYTIPLQLVGGIRFFFLPYRNLDYMQYIPNLQMLQDFFGS